MDNNHGSDECRYVACMTLGYLSSLLEGAQTDAAKELIEDWIYLVEKVAQSNGENE